jgi:hypothetical protein
VRVLLDENLDHALRKLLGTHEVVTVTYMGWAGLKNGELLKAAEESGIDILLTGDQSLCHEQNLTGRRLAIVALSAIQLPIIQENLKKVIAALDEAVPARFRQLTAEDSEQRKSQNPSPFGSAERQMSVDQRNENQKGNRHP